MNVSTADGLVSALVAGDEGVLVALADFLMEEGQDDLAGRLLAAAAAGRGALEKARRGKVYGIREVAEEFDRLFAHDSEIVDATEIGWGHGTEAGHIGHEHEDGHSIVGRYAQGGNVGHPVMGIENDDVQKAGQVLALMERADSIQQVGLAFAAVGVRYYNAH